MPVTLDSTVGGNAANTYVSMDEATAYFATRSGADAQVWRDSSDTDKKAMALISATARLDQEAFEGTRTTATQRLAFPRDGLYTYDRQTIDETTVPRAVKDACCEQALVYFMATTDLARADSLAKYSSLSVAGISLSLRDVTAPSGDSLVPVVGRLLSPFFRAVGFTRLERV